MYALMSFVWYASQCNHSVVILDFFSSIVYAFSYCSFLDCKKYEKYSFKVKMEFIVGISVLYRVLNMPPTVSLTLCYHFYFSSHFLSIESKKMGMRVRFEREVLEKYARKMPTTEFIAFFVNFSFVQT